MIVWCLRRTWVMRAETRRVIERLPRRGARPKWRLKTFDKHISRQHSAPTNKLPQMTRFRNMPSDRMGICGQELSRHVGKTNIRQGSGRGEQEADPAQSSGHIYTATARTTTQQFSMRTRTSGSPG